MDRAVLERPFPQEMIRTRRGVFGEVTYIEGALVVTRSRTGAAPALPGRVLLGGRSITTEGASSHARAATPFG